MRYSNCPPGRFSSALPAFTALQNALHCEMVLHARRNLDQYLERARAQFGRHFDVLLEVNGVGHTKTMARVACPATHGRCCFPAPQFHSGPYRSPVPESPMPQRRNTNLLVQLGSKKI